MLSCRETRDKSCEAAYLNGFGAKCRILSFPRVSLQNTLGYVVRLFAEHFRICSTEKSQKDMWGSQSLRPTKHANHASRALRTSGSTTMEKVRETSCRVCPYDSSCISKSLPQASSKTNQPQEGERAKAEQGSKPTTLSHRLPLGQITLFQMQACDYRRTSHTKKRCCRSPGAVRWLHLP